ncbi:MAG: hypothetical protein SPJ83_04360 [Helicobacter sp.]|uniref:hypothetical protein n=1 Tax=Helicobacter sp. TaxID=218 RepID=UPI002A920334|nr:hypothetical protein [Helicobacter sp.]MDY5822015.1 hypothetical protein [Helicobacter sp.]
MQNSGLSNALSPLTSLNYTFKIPILGFVSLRGERDSSGKNTDEPQHELLGVITDTLLGTCEMKYAFLDSNMDLAKEQVQKALEWLEKGESFFFIVKNKTFSKVALVSGHSVLGDKSRIASAEAAALTPSKLLASASQSHDLLKKPTAASPCTASLVFSSQSLECQNSSDTESLMDSHNAVSKNLESKTNPSNLDSKKGAWFIYLKIQKGSKENLGRPKITPQEVAQRLSRYMRECGDEF